MFLKEILILVLAAIASISLVGLAFKGKALLVKIAKFMLSLSNKLTAKGFPHLSLAAQAAAIGDWAGVIKEGEYVLRQLEDPKTEDALFDEVFNNQLAARLADAGECSALGKSLIAWQTANPTLAKAAGFSVAAVTA
jgi:hypothetical protein